MIIWGFFYVKRRPAQPELRGAAVGFPASAPDADWPCDSLFRQCFAPQGFCADGPFGRGRRINKLRPNQNGLRDHRPSGFASLPDCYFLYRFAMGNVRGLAPKTPPEGRCPSDSLLRFALMARFYAGVALQLRPEQTHAARQLTGAHARGQEHTLSLRKRIALAAAQQRALARKAQ